MFILPRFRGDGAPPTMDCPSPALSDRTRPHEAAPGRSGCLGRVGRDSPRAVAPERLAGGRVRPYLRQRNKRQSSWDLHLNKAKIRISRSEDSSGRIYECMDGSRSGTTHHLPVLLVKVKAHSLSTDGARPRKASNATRGALEKLQTQLGGPTPSDKNGV